jgi:hypothetical protein
MRESRLYEHPAFCEINRALTDNSGSSVSVQDINQLSTQIHDGEVDQILNQTVVETLAATCHPPGYLAGYLACLNDLSGFPSGLQVPSCLSDSAQHLQHGATEKTENHPTSRIMAHVPGHTDPSDAFDMTLDAAKDSELSQFLDQPVDDISNLVVCYSDSNVHQAITARSIETRTVEAEECLLMPMKSAPQTHHRLIYTYLPSSMTHFSPQQERYGPGKKEKFKRKRNTIGQRLQRKKGAACGLCAEQRIKVGYYTRSPLHFG